MKRPFLSGFDPLPHALSTKGLSALVAVVVLGTGFTVQRYVESSQAAVHHGTTSRFETGAQFETGARFEMGARFETGARFDRPSEVQAAPGEGSPAGYAKSRRSSEANESHARGCSGWRSTSTCPSVEAASSQIKNPTLPSMFQPGDASVGG